MYDCRKDAVFVKLTRAVKKKAESAPRVIKLMDKMLRFDTRPPMSTFDPHMIGYIDFHV